MIESLAGVWMMLLALFAGGDMVATNAPTPTLGASIARLERTMIPETDSLYDLGTTTKAWREGWFDTLCFTGDTCRTSWPSGSGGSGTISTSTALANTQVVYATGVSTVGSDAGFTYSAAADRFTIVNASSTAWSSAYASSTSLVAGTLNISTSLTMAGDTLDELVGTGLQVSSGDLQTTLGISIAPTEMASSDFGSFTCNGTTCTVDNGAISNAMLTNSTISGVALGGTLNALTATNGSLTFSGSYDGSAARTVGLNLANANTWTALQTFANASSTLFSSSYASSTLYFGAGLTTCDGATSALTWAAGVFGCHTIAGGGGGSGGTWATTTSTVAGQNVNYPLENDDIVAIGSNSTTTAEWWFDPNNITMSVGTGGAGSSTMVFGPDVNNQWITGYDGDDKTYAIASSTSLGVLNGLTIDKNLKTTLVNASSTLFSAYYASSTLYYGAGLANCNTGNMLTWTNGVFGCEDDSTGGGGGGANSKWATSTSNAIFPNGTTNSVVIGRANQNSINCLLCAFATSTEGSLIFGAGTGGYNGNLLLLEDSAGNDMLRIANDGAIIGSSLLEVTTTISSGQGLLVLRSDGATIGANDGVLTLTGQGNGNDENLTIDLDNAAANVVAIGSGTGVATVDFGSIGASLASTTVSGTSTTARLNVTGAVSILGEYFTNFTTYVRSLFTGDQGINLSGGSLTFDCSEVEGTGINCSGENITLDATGDWTGTLDGFNGFGYPFPSNATSTALTFSAGINLGTPGLTIDNGDTGTGLTILTAGDLGSWTATFPALTGTVALSGTSQTLDFGGSVLEIPNGTNPTANDPGELAHDTTDNQLILDDAVIPTTNIKIWSATIASTSPAFISGGLLSIPVQLDGYTISAIRCYVSGGTSKVVAIEDASANSTEDITCATTATSDDGSITNAIFTAAELGNIDFGATSGSVDYVTISVFGNWTRE